MSDVIGIDADESRFRRFNRMASLITTLRWIARLWSVASLLLLAAMVLGEGDPGAARLSPGEVIGLVFFPAGIVVGLLLGFRKERLGGLICLASLAGFYVWHISTSGILPRGPYFALFAAPGALFLACSMLNTTRLHGSRSDTPNDGA
ncbi:MAG: hypothetical protein R3C19_05970 [Planctomycetaceae bacterium]